MKGLLIIAIICAAIFLLIFGPSIRERIGERKVKYRFVVWGSFAGIFVLYYLFTRKNIDNMVDISMFLVALVLPNVTLLIKKHFNSEPAILLNEIVFAGIVFCIAVLILNNDFSAAVFVAAGFSFAIGFAFLFNLLNQRPARMPGPQIREYLYVEDLSQEGDLSQNTGIRDEESPQSYIVR